MKGQPMLIDPERFNQQFSILTNSLTVAVELARQRAARAQGEAMEADELFEAVRRAAEAARALRPANGSEPQS
jgi:hypothetical protein